MNDFNGQALFLDRSDINTDEIIPAKYLSEVSKKAMGPHLFEDLRLEGFDPHLDISGKRVVVARENFGCGSSREHAPWALEANRIHIVIATSFARIFRRNMFNCGLLAVSLDADIIAGLFDRFGSVRTDVSTDLDRRRIRFDADGQSDTVAFSLTAFDRRLVEAGGWLAYADRKY
jgi:3-isopropylmalate/(R)-2-methylmalate dehydratase small subunit